MRVIDHVLGQSSEALETKEREIRQLKEENKGLKEQITEFRAVIKHLEDENRELLSAKSQIAQEMRQDIDLAAVEKVESLEEILHSVLERNTALEARIKVMNKDVVDLSQDSDSDDHENLDDLQECMADIEAVERQLQELDTSFESTTSYTSKVAASNIDSNADSMYSEPAKMKENSDTDSSETPGMDFDAAQIVRHFFGALRGEDK